MTTDDDVDDDGVDDDGDVDDGEDDVVGVDQVIGCIQGGVQKCLRVPGGDPRGVLRGPEGSQGGPRGGS